MGGRNGIGKGRVARETDEDKLEEVYVPSYLKRSLLKVELAEFLPGAVRVIKERIGEVQNLKDPIAQERSVCALLARKYRLESSFLASINAGAVTKRELSLKECQKIREVVEQIKRGESPNAEISEDTSGDRGGAVLCAQPAPSDGVLPEWDPGEERPGGNADDSPDSGGGDDCL